MEKEEICRTCKVPLVINKEGKIGCKNCGDFSGKKKRKTYGESNKENFLVPLEEIELLC